MGLEMRRGRLYLYEKEWRDGTCRSVYRGSGEVAEMRAALASIDRAARAARRAEDRERRAEADRADAKARDLCRSVDRVVSVVLTAAGFQRVDRGEWRRRMGGDKAIEADRVPLTRSECETVLARVEAGDQSAEGELAAWFRNEGAKVLDACGSPQCNAERVLVQQWAGEGAKQAPYRVAARVKMEALRRELYGPEPTPLERLLADRVVYCWFYLFDLEQRLLRARDQSCREAEFDQRRIDRANGRFLAACKALATIRRLDVSMLTVNAQVNIGDGGK